MNDFSYTFHYKQAGNLRVRLPMPVFPDANGDGRTDNGMILDASFGSTRDSPLALPDADVGI